MDPICTRKGKLAAFSIVTMLLFILSCGGGGSSGGGSGNVNPAGTGMTDADLSGTYFVGEIRVEDSVGTSTAMEVDCDGAGNLTATLIADSSGDSGTDTQTYSVADDGVLTVGSDAPGESIKGQLSSNGQYLNLVDVYAAGNDLGIVFGIIRSTGMTNADFDGTYIMSQIGFDPDPWSAMIRLTADGNGNFDYEQIGSGDSGSGTYNVDDDGSLTIIGDANAYAQLSPDGSAFLMVDVSDYAFLALGIRKSSGMSNTDFYGTYHSVAFEFENEDIDSALTARVDLTSDGTGNVTSAALETSEGTPETESHTFSVADDGTISTSFGMLGQLSENGTLYAFPDADETAIDFTTVIGIQKP